MRFIGNLIQTVTTVFLLFILLWWSLFCFSRGFNLGQNGTENRLLNWALVQFLADKAKEEGQK